MIRSAQINLYTDDLPRLVAFYAGLGLRETFRTPVEGDAEHVELRVDGFTLGIATVEAARRVHGLHPDLTGNRFEIVLWTDDLDGDFARLQADGVQMLSKPRDFGERLRVAWVTDPDGSSVQLVQSRD